MNVIPVIERELRAQARQPGTFWMRVLAAGVVMVVFWVGTVVGGRSQPSRLGRDLFLALNGAVHYLIWIGVPLLVADSISREKREGTLGLLFLTPLSASDVVMGKGIILGWRALGILMAGMPVLVLPFLLGGVSWRNACVMGSVHGVSLVLSLLAGMTASALSRHFMRAMLAGLILSFALSVVLNGGLALFLHGQEDVEYWFSGPAALVRTMDWAEQPVAAGSLRWVWISGLVVMVVALMVGMYFRVVRQVESFWQEAPVGTGRVRRAVGDWLRVLVRLAVAVALMLVVLEGQERPENAAMLALAGVNVMLCLAVWTGLPAWVIRSASEAEGLEVQRHVKGGLVPLVEGERWRRSGWLRPARGAGWWVILAAAGLFLGTAGLTRVVTWWAVVVAMVNPLAVALLAFGVGSLAWGWGRSWMRSVVRSVAIGVPVFVVWCLAQGFVICHLLVLSHEVENRQEFWQEGVHIVLMVGALVGSGGVLAFGDEALGPLNHRVWLLDSSLVLLGSGLMALVLCWLGRRLEDRPVRAPVGEEPGVSLTKDLGEPVVARAFFRRRRQRVLEQNPMRWLLERSRTARLRRVGWMALVATMQTVMVVEDSSLSSWAVWLWHGVILFLLSIGLAVASGMSFQEEKRTGAMELILVTPLPVRRIIAGRWRGLVGQFLPALGLLGLVCALAPLWGYRGYMQEAPVAVAAALAGVMGFISVPPLGMLLSLRTRSVVGACLGTLALPVFYGGMMLLILYVDAALGRGARTPFGVLVELAPAVVGLLVLMSVVVAWGAVRSLGRAIRGRDQVQ